MGVYRVIQWGAGVNGSALIRAVARHPDLELVGCRVWSAAKAGVDAGTLAGIDELGVPATTNPQELYDLDADVVLFLPAVRPDLSETDAELLALLASGKNVISVTGAHSMPTIYGDYYAAFDAACVRGGTTFTAAGINPGFIAERLAPTVTGMCADVTRVVVSESWDCSHSSADTAFEVNGFGRPLDEWQASGTFGQMFNRMFSQVIHNMAHSFGVELERVDLAASVTPAHRDMTIAGRTIPAGSVGATHLVWTGVPSDPDQIELVKETTWAAAADIPGVPVGRVWTVRVEGKPNLTVTVDPGLVEDPQFRPEALVGAAIPLIPAVVAADPGFLLPEIQAPFRRRFDQVSASAAIGSSTASAT